MGGHAWSVTSEDAKCERGRISKVRARCYLENHESYNFHIGLIGPHGGKARANSAVKHFYNMPSGSTDSSWHLLLGYMASWRLPATLNPHRDVPRAKASQKGPSGSPAAHAS